MRIRESIQIRPTSLLLSTLGTVHFLFGQIDQIAIIGTVTDSPGTIGPGADVTLTAVATSRLIIARRPATVQLGIRTKGGRS